MIDLLDKGTGCFASNAYFANILNKDRSYIKNRIIYLKKHKLIEVKNRHGTRTISRHKNVPDEHIYVPDEHNNVPDEHKNVPPIYKSNMKSNTINNKAKNSFYNEKSNNNSHRARGFAAPKGKPSLADLSAIIEQWPND